MQQVLVSRGFKLVWNEKCAISLYFFGSMETGNVCQKPEISVFLWKSYEYETYPKLIQTKDRISFRLFITTTLGQI